MYFATAKTRDSLPRRGLRGSSSFRWIADDLFLGKPRRVNSPTRVSQTTVQAEQFARTDAVKLRDSVSDVFIPTGGIGARCFFVCGAIVILAIALGLRVWRIDGPYEHFDEKIAVHVSHHLEQYPGWDDNWKNCEIPVFSTTDQYNFSAYLYSTHLFRRLAAPLLPVRWNEERMGIVIHRLFSALCGTATVLLLMLITQRIGGGFLMLGAGLLATLNVQLVQDAHYARPEAFMNLLFITIIWLGFLPSAGSWRPTTMALLIGLLTAVKFTNAMLVFLPFFVAWQLGSREGFAPARFGRLLIVVLLAFVSGWAVGVPYALIHPSAYIAGVEFLSRAYAGVFPPYTLPDHGASWPTMRACFLATHGFPLLSAMALGSIWYLWRRRINEVILLLVPVAGYVMLFGTQKMFVERNLSPILPVALLMASVGFAILTGWLWRSNFKLAGVIFLAAISLASITGDRALWLLLHEGVTGKETAAYDAYLKNLRRDFPDVRLSFTSFFNNNDMDWLKGELIGRREVLLNVFDFNDAYKLRGFQEMERRFNAFPVAEYRGTFADYPLSGLNNFHGPRLRTYLVRSLAD